MNSTILGGTRFETAPGMSSTILAPLFIAGAALYFMTPEERRKLAQTGMRVFGSVRAIAHPQAPADPFEDFLRARTEWPVVTPVLLVVNTLLFIGMMMAPGPIDKQTLIEWGANYAPQTTNGEWSRWVSSMFVHGGVLHLAATLAGMGTIGIVLERAIGRAAFAAAFFASGIVASIVSVWTSSATAVTFGASGGLFGIYGLLIATIVWGCLRSPRVPFSVHAAKRIVGGGVICIGYTLVTDHLGLAAELAGMTTGMAAGLVIARGVAREKPAVLRAAVVAFAALVITVVSVTAVERVVDARPELGRTLLIEQRIAGAYTDAVNEFTLGRIPAKTLAQLIERNILPSLEAERARIEALRGVPREQAPLVAAAKQYFNLRAESWRRRVVGLRNANSLLLREAERSERAALEALQRTRAS